MCYNSTLQKPQLHLMYKETEVHGGEGGKVAKAGSVWMSRPLLDHGAALSPAGYSLAVLSKEGSTELHTHYSLSRLRHHWTVLLFVTPPTSEPTPCLIQAVSPCADPSHGV